MTLDTDALLKLADEADAERAKTTAGPWHSDVVVIYTDDGLQITRFQHGAGPGNAHWTAKAHEREGLLTEGLRELAAEVEELSDPNARYPTKDAYEALCAAFHAKEQQLAEARAEIERWKRMHVEDAKPYIADLQQQLAEARARIAELEANNERLTGELANVVGRLATRALNRTLDDGERLP